jgi:hypothetical protein
MISKMTRKERQKKISDKRAIEGLSRRTFGKAWVR